jgi:hypothetical protein
MGELIQFRGVTKLNLDPDITLEGTKGKLKDFVIMGYDKEGEIFFSSTMADGGDVLWLLERFKAMLMRTDAI